MPIKRRRKLSGVEANFRRLFRAAKQTARKRRIEFNLTPERFREITSSNCYYCGRPPSRHYRHDKREYYREPYIYNGVDRFENSKGYEDGNVVPCCWICNRAKGSLSTEEFLLYLYDAYNHIIKPALEGNIYADE